MQYLKHSTTEVMMTALSDGLDAARSLDRLRQISKVMESNGENHD